MKAKDFTKCLLCGKGMAHAGNLTFLRIQIEYFGLNLRAVQRAAGLEMQIGALAHIMGPNEDLAKCVSKGAGLICGTCMLASNVMPFQLMEAATLSGPAGVDHA